ncbi:MAG: VIT1/CCC1 family protein [Candidatus Lokiarchaeota archaeon]|nr:VIT1/CCC1 family protein [Candidatus Lokiarchaeota archaeon]
MPLNSSLKDKLIKIQEKEITEYNVYRRVSESTIGQNSKILKQISEDELRHYNEWKEYTHTEVNPDRLVVLKYLIISKIFGIMFMMKLLEGNEEKAQTNYSKIAKELPEANKILADEVKHEKLLIEMIDEKRLNYLSSIISGLNDALIELAGELAGFTFALQNTSLIGFAGLIAGIAQFLSSSASEIELFLTERNVENKEAIKKSVFEGSIYLVTVFFLIIPFFFTQNAFLAMGISAFNSFLIIIFFTYYVSIVKELPLKKMFSITVLITLGIGTLSFIIGWIVKTVLNL